MILTRQSIKGGRKVTGFPIREENGHLGYFLGYCPCGCNEQVMMCLQDRDLLVACFHHEDKTLEKLRGLIKPKLSLYESFLKWLGEWIARKTTPGFVDNI